MENELSKQTKLDLRYLRMARIWAENSYCKRRQVGALVVKDKMLGTYQSGGWWDWNGGAGHSAMQAKRGSNDDLSYLHRKEISATVHAEVLNKALSFDVDLSIIRI